LKRNAVTGAKIQDGAVTGAKIQASTLGAVPNAAHAASADRAAVAGRAATADRAATAGSVDSLPKPEQVRLATLLNGCANANVALFGPAGFFKDGFGIVHLTGQLQGCTPNADAFVLPPGFRPPVASIHSVPGPDPQAEIEVLATGEVRPFSTTNPSLGGITFRTD
jgi:hypothetical protein